MSQTISSPTLNNDTTRGNSLSTSPSAPSPAALPQAGVKCPICTEDLVNVTTVQPCGHQFNLECILAWLETTGARSRRCPMCRHWMQALYYEMHDEDEEDEVSDASDGRPASADGESRGERADREGEDDAETGTDDTEAREEARRHEEMRLRELRQGRYANDPEWERAFELINRDEGRRILARAAWKSPLWQATYMEACAREGDGEGEHYVYVQRTLELSIEQRGLKTTSRLKRELKIERKRIETSGSVGPFQAMGSRHDVSVSLEEADRILARWPQGGRSDDPKWGCYAGVALDPVRNLVASWEKWIYVERHPESPGSITLIWHRILEETGPAVERPVDPFPVFRHTRVGLRGEARECRDEIQACLDWLRIRGEPEADHALEEGTTNLLEPYDRSYQCGYCGLYHRHGNCLLPWGGVDRR